MSDIFIGIDGGGSHTAGVAMDAQGRLLAQAAAGGSAIVGAPSTAACQALATVFGELCAGTGIRPAAVAAVGLGLSGIDFADEFAVQHAALSACLGVDAERLTLVNDGIIALWGASSQPAAVTVQHGSGFTSAWRAGFGTEQLFDHLDVGRMFDLRQALPGMVQRMLDGRRPATPLKALALRHYGVTDDAAFAELAFRERLPRAAVTTAPAVVFAAWQEQDPAATELVLQAAADYVATARALALRTGASSCDVRFGGGVLRHAPDAFLRLLSDGVRNALPAAAVGRPLLPPAWGGAAMAAVRAGRDPESYYRGMMSNPPGLGQL